MRNSQIGARRKGDSKGATFAAEELLSAAVTCGLMTAVTTHRVGERGVGSAANHEQTILFDNAQQ